MLSGFKLNNILGVIMEDRFEKGMNILKITNEETIEDIFNQLEDDKRLDGWKRFWDHRDIPGKPIHL